MKMNHNISLGTAFKGFIDFLAERPSKQAFGSSSLCCPNSGVSIGNVRSWMGFSVFSKFALRSAVMYEEEDTNPQRY